MVVAPCAPLIGSAFALSQQGLLLALVPVVADLHDDRVSKTILLTSADLFLKPGTKKTTHPQKNQACPPPPRICQIKVIATKKMIFEVPLSSMKGY